MLDFYSLIKDTNAFKTVKGDRDGGRLSHAYLLICADGKYLTEYLKFLPALSLAERTYLAVNVVLVS